MASKSLNSCLQLLCAMGPSQIFQRQFDQAKVDFLSDPEVSADLLEIIGTGQDKDVYALRLLGLLLCEARMGLENDAEHAESFLFNLSTMVEMVRKGGLFSPVQLIALAGEYRRADLPVPAALIMNEDDAPIPDGMIDFDPTTHLVELADSITKEDGTVYDVFSAIDEFSAALPDDVRSGLAYHLATIDGPVFEWCGLYMLLDRVLAVQDATVDGLRARLNSGAFEPETMRLLPMIRGWLPKGDLRDKLDDLFKQARRKSPSFDAAAPKTTITQIWATMTDGVGAQSLMVKVGEAEQVVLAIVLLKDGFGVKDAYIACEGDEREIRDIVEQFKNGMGVEKIS